MEDSMAERIEEMRPPKELPPRGEWGSDKNILFAVRDLMAAADLEGSVSWEIDDGELVISTGCIPTDGFDKRLVRVSGGIRMHMGFDETVDAVE